jgi:hypothetical protein
MESDSSPHQMWRERLLIKCEECLLYRYFEEWLLSTSNARSDSSLRLATPLHIRVSSPHQWLHSTSHVMSNSSQHRMRRVTPLHIRCEEWMLSTANLKSDSKCDVWPLFTSKVKSDSTPHQIWRVTPLYVNLKSDSSPSEMWRVTPLHIKCEEWLHIKC